MNLRRRLILVAFGISCLLACSPAQTAPPHKTPKPPTRPVPVSAEMPKPAPDSVPPLASHIPQRPFPAISDVSMDNGLSLQVIEQHALPVVTAELIINSGLASEEDRAGSARLAAEWLEAGGAGRWSSRQLREAVDTLGASLEIAVSRDAARFSLTVTSDHIDAALEILAALVQKPRFDQSEFEKLKQREVERVESLSRTSGTWMAQMWLQRQLFRLPIGVHPYASYDVLPDELRRLTAAMSRNWFREFVSPRNAYLLLVGDIAPSAAHIMAERHFAAWSGPEVRAFNPSSTEGLSKFEIFVVDKPNSTQSDIFLATLGPNRHDPAFAWAALAQQVVGVLEVQFAKLALEQADFPVDVVALVGRIAHVVIHLHRGGPDAADEGEVLLGAQIVLQPQDDARPLGSRGDFLQDLDRPVQPRRVALQFAFELVGLEGFCARARVHGYIIGGTGRN